MPLLSSSCLENCPFEKYFLERVPSYVVDIGFTTYFIRNRDIFSFDFAVCIPVKCFCSKNMLEFF